MNWEATYSLNRFGSSLCLSEALTSEAVNYLAYGPKRSEVHRALIVAIEDFIADLEHMETLALMQHFQGSPWED